MYSGKYTTLPPMQRDSWCTGKLRSNNVKRCVFENCGQNKINITKRCIFYQFTSRVFGSLIVWFFIKTGNNGIETHSTISLVFDEHVASLVLLWMLRDTKEGWTQWGHVSFVNRTCRDAFKTYHTQAVEYRFVHMQHILKQKNWELQLFSVCCCSCRVTCPDLWSSDDVSDDEAVDYETVDYQTDSSLTSPEY